MKILIVDDEADFSALLCRALRKLGHEAIAVCEPADALERLASDDVDGVITDIDMPGMSGLELAHAIKERAPELPIVFCSGSLPGTGTLEQAQRLGPVLSKVWAIAQVREVVSNMEEQAGERTAVGDDPPAPPAQVGPLKFKVSCRTWEMVRKLCDAQLAGRHFVSVRAPRTTRPGAPAAIALKLPDELVLSIAGTVASVRHEGLGDEAVCFIELTGLTTDLVARLRGLCAEALAAGGPSPPESGTYLEVSRHRPVPRGSQPGLPRPARLADGTEENFKVSEIIIGNLRLRRQIEALAAQMRPRRKTDPIN